MTSNQPAELTAKVETRGFRAFHDFMRASRQFMEKQVWDQAFEDYHATIDSAAPPKDARAAMDVLDDLPSFQLYGWMYRRLQQFKYRYPEFGIIPAVDSERPVIQSALEEAAEASQADGTLRLDPGVPFPDYYRLVDFHQHPGGVWGDEMAGVVYELARRTTLPTHMDPNDIYRQMYSYLPADGKFDRVLDWGTGHGAGIMTWLEGHPDSEAHAVDLAVPCLKLANLRARERGMKIHFTQQDLADLDFPDDNFDLVTFLFMLHEIPPKPTRELLAEAYRVLKPGGLFFGVEFLPVPDDAFQNAMLIQSSWANNEPFSPAFFEYPHADAARELGFSKCDVIPFDKLMGSLPNTPGVTKAPPYALWVIYRFEK